MREEEKNRSSQSSSFKRFFKKRWVFPAIYVACAAIILTGVLWYQQSAANNASDNYKSTDLAGKKFNQPSVEVNRAMENFVMPVKDTDQVVVAKKFYDFKASKNDQEAALVFYNNTYEPNTGIDYTMKNGETFDVVSALSGTVTRVDEDSLLGNVIEIDHGNGVVTLYESVKDMKIKVGDQVEQGQAIAMAGQSLLNEKAGTHVHFEIRKDGVAVNPENYFNKPLSDLEQEKATDTQADKEKASPKSQKDNLDQSDDGASTPSDNSTDTIDNENS